MQGIDAPSSIITLLDAIRAQINVITTLSSGGLGVIIFTWGRILGILDGADFSSFRYPCLLSIPAFFLLCAVILGYFTGAQTTGYLTEIAQGVSAKGAKIVDAHDHYFTDYHSKFDYVMGYQFFMSIAGIILIAVWFMGNVAFNLRRKK